MILLFLFRCVTGTCDSLISVPFPNAVEYEQLVFIRQMYFKQHGVLGKHGKRCVNLEEHIPSHAEQSNGAVEGETVNCCAPDLYKSIFLGCLSMSFYDVTLISNMLSGNKS